MSEQDPTTTNREDWKAYWKEQRQPWLTEPEIDRKRQEELAQCRAIVPDLVRDIYPFRGIKLSRADIEWLLATHDNGRGPVDWNNESQPDPHFARKGLDLRGADLRNVDLRELPLARLIGGDLGEFEPKSEAKLEKEAIQLEGATLVQTHLEGAVFNHSHLEGANLYGAHLEQTLLIRTHLEGANLSAASLKRANLYGAHLEGANLTLAHLEGAHLSKAFFDGETNLEEVYASDDKDGAFYLADIHWGDVNVDVVDWQRVSVFGDEPITEKRRLLHRRPKPKANLVKNYQKAVRAYRQVAIVLRSQGINEEASPFAYRAQLMQRKVFWQQRKFGRYFFSVFLDLLAGYGFKPWRSFLAYLIVISVFAATYYILGLTVGPVLSPLGSVVFSMTSFHGRGFFPGGIGLDNPLTVVAAFEAFVGLLIEVTFIATLTQRLFGK